MKELILGGVRSGKSRLAESRALDTRKAITYIATAMAGDDEMQARIAHHRARRPADWTVVEEPRALASVLRDKAGASHCILVDCLTLWVTNLLCEGDDAKFRKERDALLSVLPNLPGHIILVSNEANMGIIPLGKLSRRFCDETGWLHQELAQICDRVTLVIAGLPHVLKGTEGWN